MSDDKRRDDTGGYGTDFGDDFGTVEFADDDKAPTISFGDDTGPLPHWTEPPTAELPRTPQRSPPTREQRPNPRSSCLARPVHKELMK